MPALRCCIIFNCGLRDEFIGLSSGCLRNPCLWTSEHAHDAFPRWIDKAGRSQMRKVLERCQTVQPIRSQLARGQSNRKKDRQFRHNSDTKIPFIYCYGHRCFTEYLHICPCRFQSAFA